MSGVTPGREAPLRMGRREGIMTMAGTISRRALSRRLVGGLLPRLVGGLLLGCAASLPTAAVLAGPAAASPAPRAAGGPSPAPGTVAAFGHLSNLGGAEPAGSAPAVGIAATPKPGGYWLAASNGGVFTFGNAPFFGSMGGKALVAPVVGIAADPATGGYWEVASDGGIFAFNAPFFGSMGGKALNAPIVGISAMSNGLGYWLVARDGGIFAFGRAPFFGSMGGKALVAPVVGIAADPATGGYWEVASDGGVFTFNSPFFGSMGGKALGAPIAGIAATSNGLGYRMVAMDGGIFAFGNASFLGSSAGPSYYEPPGGSSWTAPAVGIASAPGGYWVAYGARESPLGQAVASYLATRSGQVTAAVYDASTGQTFQLNPGVSQDTASIVKVDILATALAQAQASGRPLPAGEAALAVPMIEQSSNQAATALWNDVGGAPGVAAFDSVLGLSATTPGANGYWGLTTTTASDQVTIVRALAYPGPHLSGPSRSFETDLMEHVIAYQAWGVSAGTPTGATIALKNGWLPLAASDWQVNSIGWVSGAGTGASGNGYVIAVLTTGNPTMAYGIQTVQQVSSMASAVLTSG
ncbi:MAG: serine hydrolase [Acidimicrobiales bacterium]